MMRSNARLIRDIRHSGVNDDRVLHAIELTPREMFVPPEYAARAYDDGPVPIGHNQTTSQPSLIALMLSSLRLPEDAIALEIGTGYGYQTALLSRLARHVYSVERWPDLAERARQNLRGAGIENATVVVGDGMKGLAEHAPYQGVVVSAVGKRVPDPLAEQVAEGGRLVMPLLSGWAEVVVLFHKRDGRLAEQESLTFARFVPLVPGTEPR